MNFTSHIVERETLLLQTENKHPSKVGLKEMIWWFKCRNIDIRKPPYQVEPEFLKAATNVTDERRRKKHGPSLKERWNEPQLKVLYIKTVKDRAAQLTFPCPNSLQMSVIPANDFMKHLNESQRALAREGMQRQQEFLVVMVSLINMSNHNLYSHTSIT